MTDLHIKAVILSQKTVDNLTFKTVRKRKMKPKRKSSLIDRIIEKLPEMHIIGYSFCGPNTDLQTRLARGERGINALDCACMEHDIAYAESDDLKTRIKADKLLILKAFRRVYANDSQIGERFAASTVAWIITVKLFLTNMEICIRKWCTTLKSRKTYKNH